MGVAEVLPPATEVCLTWTEATPPDPSPMEMFTQNEIETGVLQKGAEEEGVGVATEGTTIRVVGEGTGSEGEEMMTRVRRFLG